MTRAMPALLVSIVLLAAWLGAATVVALAVAPAAFAVLPTRTLAGALVGRVLPPIFWSGIIVGPVVAVVTWSLPHRGWRTGGALLLGASCVAAQLVIAPRIAAIRAELGGAIDAVHPLDPRRVAFGRLHALSVGLIGLGGLAAFITLIALVRFTATRTIP